MLGKDFISLEHCSSKDLRDLIAVARYLKRRRQQGVIEHALEGQTLGMLFEKPSLRTRVSFEVGMAELGGQALYLSRDEVGLGKREAVEDVARVLSRYVHGVMVRTFAHENVVKLAEHASVPVINGLSDDCHPCQSLADMQTIEERHGTTGGLKIVFIGDANNVSRSLARACVLAGSDFVLACPEDYRFGEADIADFGDAWGTRVQQIHDPQRAVADADVLYTDVWTSMGQEAERAERLERFAGYQINRGLLSGAAERAIVMHCLPAHRGEEITAEVLESDLSVVFDQAENRLHAQKAIMRLLMAKDRETLLAAVYNAAS